MKVIQDVNREIRVESANFDRASAYILFGAAALLALVLIPLPASVWTFIKFDVGPIVVYEVYGWRKRRAEQIETVRQRLLGRPMPDVTGGFTQQP